MTVALFAKPSLASQVARLFARGEQGAWYDPSDLSTLFQDAAGTIPVTGVEQPVGRMLDKSGRGNHATQATATSRPVLSGRVNQLISSEGFSDSAWIKAPGGSISEVNTVLAPNGTMTADVWTQGSVPGTTRMYQAISVLPSVAYKHSISAKRIAGTWIRVIALTTDNANGFVAWFNLATGTKGGLATVGTGATAISSDIQPDNNGFYRLSVTGIVGAVSSMYACWIDMVEADGSSVRQANASAAVWGADTRPANDGIGLPPYQRVNSATDYDTVGFPLYLACDGVDDGMATGLIDFTGTDKVLVAAGVRKIGTYGGTLVELSADYGQNSAFALFAPSTLKDAYGFRTRGTSTVILDADSQQPSPITNVVSGAADISGDRAIIRVNRSQAGISTADQGTGNYGNYPLYLFRRGGAQLPFAGRFYGAVIRGAESTEAQIRAVERFLNSKTRAW